MSSIMWLFLECLLITLVSYEGQAAFNCNRPGMGCVHGSCDFNNQCNCHKGYIGPMCEQDKAKLAANCPSTYPCKTGRCTLDDFGSINGCHCDYEYYGPACDKPRYTLECFYDRMLIGLNPMVFKGHIRYIDKLTSSFCDLKPILMMEAEGSRDFINVDWDGYGIKALHKNDPCNGDAVYSTTHGFDIYTRKIVVQYYDRVYVSLDEIVTFICAVEKSNPINVMKSVFTAPLEEGFLDKPSVRGVGTHFVFSLHKSDSEDEIGDGDTMQVGVLVFLRVKVREHSPYATLIIESCTADDGSEEKNTTYYSFHEEGCPVPPVGQWVMKPNAKEFQLYFKIFRFEDTNQIRITCVVRGCTTWDSPSCSITMPSKCSHVDRRKREALDSVQDRTLSGGRHKLHLRTPRGASRKTELKGKTSNHKGKKPNKVVLPDDPAKANGLNSSEVIRLTVVISDKKKDGQDQDSIMVREVSAPDFTACTLSVEFWIVIIGITIVVVALTATTISCGLKRRKLQNKRKRKQEKTVKMALNNMKRMQMTPFSWPAYNP